jgi:hypothetical protein
MAAGPTRQLVPVDLGGGVDTFTNPKLVMPGSLLEAENVRYNRDGVIERRNGFAQLGATFQVFEQPIEKLLVRDEQLAAYHDRSGAINRFDGTKWAAQSEFRGALPVPWANSRFLGPSANNINSVFSTPFNGYSTDVASNARSGGTEMAVAYCACGTTARVDIFDAFTGAVKQTLDLGVAAYDIKIAYCPSTTDYLVAINTALWGFAGSTNGNIVVRRIRSGVDGSTLVWTSPTVARGGGYGFDFCHHPLEAKFAVLYSTTGNVVTLGMFNDTTYASITPVTVTAAATPTTVAIARPTLTSPWIRCFICGTGIGTEGFTVNGGTLFHGLFNVSAYVDGVSACHLHSVPYVTVSQPTGVLNTTARFEINNGTTVSSFGSFYVGTPASGIMVEPVTGGNCYQWMLYYHATVGGAFQNCYFLSRALNGYGYNQQPAGRVLYGKAAYPPPLGNLPSLIDFTARSGAEKAMSTVLQSSPLTNGNPETLRTSFNLVNFGLDPASGWQTQEAGKTLFVTGGYLAKFDGVSITENGFLLAPEKPTLAAAGSGVLGAGTYLVCGVFEEIDAQGNVHRSAQGIVGSQTLTGGGGSTAISVTIKAYSATGSEKQMRLALYRTIAGGTQLFREGVAAMTASGGNVVVTLGLTTTDAVLATRESMYTFGGNEDTYQPSAPIAIALDQNRPYVVEGDNLGRVSIGRRQVPGNALAFFPTYYRTIDSGTSELTGLAVLPGRKIAFKKRGIFIASGDGADDTLQADTLSQFENVSNDIGAVDPRSIVATQEGIVFRSLKGFYLLGNDRSLTYIGADVDAYSEASAFKYQFAQFNKDTNEILFVSKTATPAVLVLKLFRNKRGLQYKWTTDTFNGQASLRDFTVWGGAAASSKQLSVASVSPTGAAVCAETPGIFLDAQVAASVHVRQLISTGWLKMSSIAGYGRLYAIYVLGQSYSSHKFNIEIAYDYKDVFTDAREMQSTNATIGGSAYLFKIQPKNQKCTAFRLRIYDSAFTDSTKDTYDLSGLMLDIGTYPGGARMRAEKQG